MTTRQFTLRLHNAPTPQSAWRQGGTIRLELDLVSAFHHGYIDVHRRPPREGTNPMLDEYLPLLADTDDFRFTDGHWAQGDHKTSESHRLGRVFARAYLAQAHGYRWFADIKLLLATPASGWEVRRPVVQGVAENGPMPDWLVTRRGHAAVAEAKGTGALITKASKILRDEWRPQARRIEVVRNGAPRTLKSWIVVTRWVTLGQPRTPASIYVEDPDDSDLNPEEQEGIEYWSAGVHTAANLFRLGHGPLAITVLNALAGETQDGGRVEKWRCILPGFGHLRFVGNVVPREALLSGSIWVFDEFGPRPWRGHWLHRHIVRALENASWFDGLATVVPKDLLAGRVPSEPDADVPTPSPWANVSLLSDGSLLAPLFLMEPDDEPSPL